MTLPPTVWDGVLRRLDAELPPHAMQAWVQPIVAEANGTSLRLLCPTAFHRERVRERLLPRIVACAAEEAGDEIQVELALGERTAAAPSAALPPPPPQRDRQRAEMRTPAPAPERAATEPPRARQQTFDSFVVGPCNALAREASFALAHGRQTGLTPLVLASPSGFGKTHLARAAAVEARSAGQTRVVYTSAEAFTNDFLSALRSRRTSSFKRRFREECDLLVIEDVQFLAGKTSTQLELFHTVDHLLDTGARILLTADRLPRDIPDLDLRLASTLASGVVAQLEAPDAAVRRKILRRKASGGGVKLPERCVERLVEAVRGSVRDLEGALTQVVASATLLNRPIDPELVEEALRKVAPYRGDTDALEPEAVVRAVAHFFGTDADTLASRSRRQEVLVPRQIAMYLCHRHTGASLSRIGRTFRRNHPSVANSIRRVEKALLERARLRYQLEAVSAHLEETLFRGLGE